MKAIESTDEKLDKYGEMMMECGEAIELVKPGFIIIILKFKISVAFRSAQKQRHY